MRIKRKHSLIRVLICLVMFLFVVFSQGLYCDDDSSLDIAFVGDCLEFYQIVLKDVLCRTSVLSDFDDAGSSRVSIISYLAQKEKSPPTLSL